MEILDFLGRVLLETWKILQDSSPYLLFGFLVAGLLHAWIPTEVVARHLGRGRILPVIKAALFGVPLPLCSCGVLPAALGLRQKGASKGATVSFLVSTPETGVDSIALTYALMDPLMTVFRPVAAFVTAVVAGVWENLFSREDAAAALPETSCSCGDGVVTPRAGFGPRLREGIRYAFGDLLGDLAPWLGAGFLLAGLISTAIPEDFIGTYLGEGVLPLFVMLGVGIPLYICATASTPIAAALMLKGLSPGAALVFLLAGPATNLASLTALAGTLGVGTTARYLVSISVGALVLGFLLDALYPALGLPAGNLLVTSGAEVFPPAVGFLSALVLVALVVKLYLPSRRVLPQTCSGAP